MLERISWHMGPIETWVTPLIVTYLIHSTLILAACWIVLFFAKRWRNISPELEERAWKAAILGGILTAAVQVSMPGLPFSRLPFSRLLLSGVPTSFSESSSASFLELDAEPELATVSADDERAMSASSPRKGWQVQISNTASPDEIAALLADDSPVRTATERPYTPNTIPGSSEAASRTLSSFMALAALACFAAGVCRFLFSCVRVRRALRCGQLVPGGPLRRSLDRVCRNRPVPKIRLIASATQMQPVALGCFRPTILVPIDMESKLSRKELDAVLAHETAHIARRDVWWLCLGRLLSICLPFQPLNRLAQSRWQAASEYLCDQWAIVHGVTPLSLARGLTEVASWQIEDRSVPFASLPATCRSTLVGRVKRLTAAQPVEPNWRWNHRIGFLLATILVIGSVVAAAPSMAISVDTPEKETNQSVTGHSEWDQLQMEINLLDEDIERAVALFGRVTGQADSAELIRKKELLLQRFRSLEVEFIKELK